MDSNFRFHDLFWFHYIQIFPGIKQDAGRTTPVIYPPHRRHDHDFIWPSVPVTCPGTTPDCDEETKTILSK